MVDADGFRPNVGIVLTNAEDRVLWARRVGGHDAWQFPQGGINEGESAEQALFRELGEEVGLSEDQVQIIGRTKGWLRYRLPARLRRHNSTPGFKGQKQKWFLLRLTAPDEAVCVDGNHKPEFDDWVWKDWASAVEEIIGFKQQVYRTAFYELKDHLP